MTRDWAEVKRLVGSTENIIVTGPPCSGRSTLAIGLFNVLLGEYDASDTRKWDVTLRGKVTLHSAAPNSPRIVIWDRDEIPEEVRRNLTTRFITCSAIL